MCPCLKSGDPVILVATPSRPGSSRSSAGLVASAGNGNPNLRIYGEMVALLWDEGRRDAALELENLWNHLASRHRFTLLCAYPLASIQWGPDTAPFRGICSSHSSVRVRFSPPVAELPEASGQYSQANCLGSELNALKEVTRDQEFF